jgi:hypothetical protein
MSFRSPKLLKAAKDQPCVLCHTSGWTVSAHCRSVEFGSGTGIKCPDYFTAWLCHSCHDVMDGRRSKLMHHERQDMWMRAYMRTVQQWFEQGIVVVK